MGQIIRSIQEPPALRDDAQARIFRRIRNAGGQRAQGFRSLRPLYVTAIVLGILLFGVGAKAAITWIRQQGMFSRSVASPSTLPSAPPAASRSKRASKHRPPPSSAATPSTDVDTAGEPSALSAEAAEAPPGPAVTAEVAAPAVAQVQAEEAAQAWRPGAPSPKPRPGHSLAMRNIAAAHHEARSALPAPPSTISLESELLGRALELLRAERDYAGALRTLGEYDERFPHGEFRVEANLARLDTLLALGRSKAALALLEQTEISGPRAMEAIVLRGELRAAARRCGEAISNFNEALSRSADRRLQERALYGRASCRARTGATREARTDLEDYLARYPDGIHSADVRRELNR